MSGASPSPRGQARACALALALTLLAAAPIVRAADDRPLRDEDVVRLWVGGMHADDLVTTIGEAEVDFDLSDEMVQELRLAGLPDTVIEAMQARRRELAPAAEQPAAPTETAAEPGTAQGSVEIRLLSTDTTGNAAGDESGDEPTARLRMIGVLDPKTAEALGLGDDERTIDDVAVFLACSTADHVPDQWRSVSPLGRDFVSMPRHRMLAFVSGAHRDPAPAGLKRLLAHAARTSGAEGDIGVLRLDLPRVLQADLEPEVAHDLIVGIAVHTSRRWLAVAIDAREGVVAETARPVALEATIERSGAPAAAHTSIRFGS